MTATVAPAPAPPPPPAPALPRLARLSRFFCARFPLAPNVIAGVFAAAGPVVALQAALGSASTEPRPVVVGAAFVLTALAIFLVSFAMRIYDELKDVDTDLRLAAAGDENFRDRPIVTGALRVEDLHLMRSVALGTLVVVVAMLGVLVPAALAPFAITLGLVWLSSRWFFWPRIQRDLLLAFATHNPIAAASGACALVVATWSLPLGHTPSALFAAALIGLAWFPVSAWETSRKLRAPSDETSYETYSKRLGHVAAGLVTALFMSLTAACAAYVAFTANAHWVYVAILVVSTILAVGAALRFAFFPTSSSAKVRPLAELHAIVAGAGLTIALVVEHGIAWG